MATRKTQDAPGAPLAEKKPPSDPASEKAVLGAILLNPKAFWTAHAHVRTPDAFLDGQNRLVYAAMLALMEKNEALDPVTLGAKLDSLGMLDMAGGYSYIADLTDAVPTSANVELYANVVHKMHSKRKIIRLSHEAEINAYSKGGDPEELIPSMIAELTGLNGTNLSLSGERLYDAYTAWYQRNREKKMVGLKTGIHEIDAKLILGIQEKDLFVVAGRPSDGKSSLMLSIATNVVRAGHEVLIVSIEDSKEKCVTRLHNAICPTPEYMAMNQRRDWGALDNLRRSYFPNLEELLERIHIVDQLTKIEQIGYAIRCECHQRPQIALVCVDYLQLIRTDAKIKVGDTDRINHALDGIGSIRKDVRRPIMLLSQLRRDDYKPQEGPNLSHLKGSGAIEESADICLLLWNPNADWELDVGIKGRIAKQRDGPRGVVDLRFLKPQTLIISPKHGRTDGPHQEELNVEQRTETEASEADGECPF